MKMDTAASSKGNEGAESSNCHAQNGSSTPKTSEKKQKTKPIDNSDSSLTPSANKIAKASPRATRSSQNPDFAAKQRKFLNRVHDPIRRDNSDSDNSQGSATPLSAKQQKEKKSLSNEKKNISDIKRKAEKEGTPKRSAENDDEGSAKKRRVKEPTKVVGGVDSYCWRCHRDGNVIPCGACPRVYHLRCVQIEEAPSKGWMCPECSTVMKAENTDTRTKAMRMLTLDQLCSLLRYALNRMKSHDGAEDFEKAVDVEAFPNYCDYIVKPMDLAQLERNIKARMYGSTEAFLADTKWIVHNSIIFNSVQSKFTNAARTLLKICRQEMQEIENCPDCYLNAHTRSSESWFIEACRRPHLLVWAKLKGFPFWPAKAMSTNSEGLVDVRFFGAHDRAWVPVNCCYLFSKLSPVPTSNKSKRNLEECLQELDCHIKKLRDKFGQFEYPPYKTPYDPNNEEAQLAMFLPKLDTKGHGKRLRMSLYHESARKIITDSKSSPVLAEKKVLESTPSPRQKPTVKSIKAGVMRIFTPKMVSFPSEEHNSVNLGSPDISQTEKLEKKSESLQEEQDKQSSATEHTPPPKAMTPLAAKKKTPLTAAAKKCFAVEEKTCVRCKAVSQSILDWSVDGAGNALCSACCLSDNDISHQANSDDKSCARCHAQAGSWHHGQWLCSICLSPPDTSPVKIPYKENEQTHTSESLIIDKTQVNGKDSEVNISSELYSKEGTPERVEKPSEVSSDDRPVSAAGERSEESEPLVTEQDQPTVEVPTDAPALEFAPIDSPPKFIIPKACGDESPDTSKKVSIVDRLKEKLCFVIEEAIKDRSVPEDKQNESVEVSTEGNENEVDKTNEAPQVKESSTEVHVLLHDLKKDKAIMEKLTPSEMKQLMAEPNKTSELETRSPSEIGSETDSESSLDKILPTEEENTKKKKQSHIDSVVRTIAKRKSSVDERSDQSPTVSPAKLLKESSTVILDDSNGEIPVLIIDEGESHSPDNKSSPEKLDKSRRKGIPAKVYSRSSTSTESSSPEEQVNKSRSSVEVLDEVSGQFRRASGDSNVTITVVTDDMVPPKKAKEIRSVNISKSLSLSVINESSAGLEMECEASDNEADALPKKAMPRPTARKTIPKPRKPEDPPTPSTSIENEGEVITLIDTETVVEDPLPQRLPQTKVYGPSKTKTSGSTPGQSTNVTVRSELGPANDFLENAVNKVSGKIRGMLEEMLRGLSEGGCTEATVKALQIEMERLQWRHRQELAELRHNMDLVVKEFRASLEADKQRMLLDVKHKFEVDKERLFQETKRKTWCTYCPKEATLYCCWNTAYCTYSCQQAHWTVHMNTCSNKQHTSVEGMVRPPSQQTSTYNMPPSQMHVLDDAWLIPEEEDDPKGPRGVARRRCGVCQGCSTPPCGQCYGCTNPKSHTVCKNRRCSRILIKAPQRVRQLMPPPANPPPYHQAYRPNQMYTAISHRFTQPVPRPSQPHSFPLDGHYPRGPL